MTWSYDETDLDKDTSSGRINVVRLLVGDTDTNDQQVQNEEITFSLSESGDNVYFAASWVAQVIASLYTRRVNLQLDDAIKEDLSDKAKQYSLLAQKLRQTAMFKSGGGLNIFSGGVTEADVENRRDNDTLIRPSFTRDRFRFPENVEGTPDDYYPE